MRNARVSTGATSSGGWPASLICYPNVFLRSTTGSLDSKAGDIIRKFIEWFEFAGAFLGRPSVFPGMAALVGTQASPRSPGPGRRAAGQAASHPPSDPRPGLPGQN